MLHGNRSWKLFCYPASALRTNVEIARRRGSGVGGVNRHASGFGSLVTVARERSGAGVVGDLEVVSGDLQRGLWGSRPNADVSI